MNLLAPATAERLFNPMQAFASFVTLGILAGIALALVIAKGVIVWGTATKRFSEGTQWELYARIRSWVILIVAMVVPVLMDAAFTVMAVWGLCLLCYREYAKMVGINSNPVADVVVVMCTTVLAFASLDHFDRLYFATSSLGVGLLVVLTVMEDRPKGFIQRSSWVVFGFLLFGYSLGYLGMMTHTPMFRPLLLSLILAVEANGILAYCCGKAFQGPKLIPNTSPGKTISGAVGAVCLTSGQVSLLFHCMFYGTALDRWWLLLCLGILISVVGQLGDLTLSAIKRDLGIKDFGAVILGHGGWLDRFASLVLVPPVVYHFLSLVLGPIGFDQPLRVMSGR